MKSEEKNAILLIQNSHILYKNHNIASVQYTGPTVTWFHEIYTLLLMNIIH